MRSKDVFAHFKGKPQTAKALGLSHASVYQWGDLVPPLRAAQVHKLTRGKLKFDPAAYEGYWQKQGTDEALHGVARNGQ